jgi:hypothetical protein
MIEAKEQNGLLAPQSPLLLILAWLAVGLPLLWGVAQTIKKALALF